MKVLLPGIIGLMLFAAQGVAQDASPVASSLDFEKVHALVCPDRDELRVTELPFVSSLWKARKQAAAEGKLILLIGSQGNGLAISRG